MIKSITVILLSLFMVAPAMADDDPFKGTTVKDVVEYCQLWSEGSKAIMGLRQMNVSLETAIGLYEGFKSQEDVPESDWKKIMLMLEMAFEEPVHSSRKDKAQAIKDFENYVFTDCFEEIQEQRKREILRQRLKRDIEKKERDARIKRFNEKWEADR